MFTHIQITILLSAPKSYASHMIYFVCIHRAEERGAVHEFDLITACLNLTAVRSLNREAVCVTHREFENCLRKKR
jgi:hypothetical protein